MRSEVAENTVWRLAAGAGTAGLVPALAMTPALGQTQVASLNTPIETVNVTAQKTNLDLLPNTILNTPQSINVVPAKVIQEQGLTSLQDALRNVPGITLNAGEGGSHGDQINLRGFAASDDIFLDGLRDTGAYFRDTFDIQSVEVYKGPASTLFGRGSTGGVINQITKSPQLYPIYDFSLTGGTNNEVRGTADVNYVIDDDSAFRIALMGQRSGVQDRPFVTYRRWGAAPSYAWGIGTDTTVTLKFFHQQQDDTPDYGIPFLFGEPAPVPRDTFYGLPSDDRTKTDVNVFTDKVEHKFNDWLSLTSTSRYGSYWFDSQQTAPIYGTANCFATATAPYTGAPLCAGAPADVPVTAENPLFPVLGTPLDQIFVLRDRPSGKGTYTTLENHTDAHWTFDTGPFSHQLITGFEIDREALAQTRFVNQDDEIVPVPLLNPDPFEEFPGHQTDVRQSNNSAAYTLGFYATDSIAFGSHWNLVGGLRFDHFSARFTDRLTGTVLARTDDVVSPRVALTYKPTEDSSIYVSYGTSFNPSAENLSLAVNTQDLAPERDHTIEGGAKKLWLQGMLSTTAAIFHTNMENARISDPASGPGLLSLADDETVNGFEFDLAGYILPQWEVDAGYTYLDGSATGLIAPGVKGPLPNTAHNQATVWTTYDFYDGFKVGTGIYWTGRRDAGTDTMVDPGTFIVAQIPSSVTWDAMISYQVNDHLNLQLNGYNLTNAYYFTNSYFTRSQENHVIPGAGRTFMLTANVSL